MTALEGVVLGQKIGVVSQKMPEGPKAFYVPKDAMLCWFDEIEACFAYLLSEMFDKLYIDQMLLSDTQTCMGKYQKQLEQLHPNLEINFVDLTTASSAPFPDNFRHYPKLDTLFKNGDLKSVFQPIMKANGHDVSLFGFECLSRFRYNGQDFPPEFVFNYAQEKLKLVSSDKICLMQALRLIPHKDTLIFINVRPQTLISTDFYPWFKSLLKKHQILPEQIVVEVTEQYCNISEIEMSNQCQILQNHGLQLAIDDFGSGISNLSMLEIMRPSYLKISGRFTKNAHLDESKQKIISNVLSLAEGFGITAIVESIEVSEEWTKVKSLGASLGQGFYFHRPMAADDFRKLFVNKDSGP
jgi:EAL domain-containing protein (putative c-di-GMP-specific phosphodiesterase class I)